MFSQYWYHPCHIIHNRIGRQKLSSQYRPCSQNRSTASPTRHCKTGDLHARKLYNCRTRNYLGARDEFTIKCILEAPPLNLSYFIFFLQIRRILRLSVCAFYIRVKVLYTLKHHPAESVTSDFFIADPTLQQPAAETVVIGSKGASTASDPAAETTYLRIHIQHRPDAIQCQHSPEIRIFGLHVVACVVVDPLNNTICHATTTIAQKLEFLGCMWWHVLLLIHSTTPYVMPPL